MFRAPRGTRDILPDEHYLWEIVLEKAKKLCEIYGYRRIDTPIFEDALLFLKGVGEGTDIAEKEMYVFKDKSGKDLALRPEMTAPIARAYIEHGMHTLPGPLKLYYIGPCFRYERPQAGRYREHHQFGVEALGEEDPLLDTEVIDMGTRFLKELGIDFSLHINSIGCKKCRPGYVEKLKEFYGDRLENLCENCRRRYERNPLRLLDCKEERCLPFIKKAPKTRDFLCEDCLSHYEKLKEYLSILGINYEEDPRLVRGLDYYTRTVFEAIPPDGGALLGGGRYDDLIEALGGKKTPGVGFACGIERVVSKLKKEERGREGVIIVHIGEEAKRKGILLLKSLRERGIRADISFGDRSLKSQIRTADSKKFRFALIIGEDEIKKGRFILRDLERGEQIEVGTSPDDIEEVLKYKWDDRET